MNAQKTTPIALTARQQIEEIMRAAFPPERDRKSSMYMAGVRSVLMQRLLQQQDLRLIASECPHHLGTMAADAWLAGRTEGKVIARRLGLVKRLAPGVRPAAKICRRLHAAAPDLLKLVQAIQAEVDDYSATPRLSAHSYLPPSLLASLRFLIVRAGGRLAPTKIHSTQSCAPMEADNAV